MDKNWTEIIITVPVADGETAASVAQMTVPYGMYIEDYSDLEEAVEEIAHIDLIDEELVARDRDRRRGGTHRGNSGRAGGRLGLWLEKVLPSHEDRQACCGLPHLGRI